MRCFVIGGMLLFAVAIATEAAAAKCGTQPGDAQAVSDARTAVDDACDCATAQNHGAYVSCVRGVVNQRVHDQLLPPSCGGGLKKCAARSTCGKAGFVTCCRTKADGTTKCSTKLSDRCTAPPGGSACVGVFSSCCDACTASGCASSPSGAFLDESASAF